MNKKKAKTAYLEQSWLATEKEQEINNAPRYLKTVQKLLDVLEVIQAFWLKHAVLIKKLIHDKIHEGNLGEWERLHVVHEYRDPNITHAGYC